ncbi:MAG: GNAT family N-acetyltransferase [Rhodospirillaceae bacterium]|nr:GNAT family N-acetyltransferase [Rhodospirillaceae bacterium]
MPSKKREKTKAAKIKNGFEIRTVAPEDAKTYLDYTYPLARETLLSPEDKALILVAAHSGDDVIGFGFGWGAKKPNPGFELISLYINPFLRQQSIGSAILSKIEEEFAKLGYKEGVHFLMAEDGENPLGKFLAHNNWHQVAIRQIICKSTIDLAYETPWLVRARLPDGYRIKRWDEVSEDERAAVQRRQETSGPWYADDQDPFAREDDCHKDTSLALMKGDEVVGWVITHVIGEEVLRWTISFVSPDLQSIGRILPLWWEVAQRQAKLTNLKRFTWGVPVAHPRMLRFAQTRMKPWLQSMSYAVTMHKMIAGD